MNADLGDVEVLLQKADEALKAEDFKGLEPLIDRAEATAKALVSQNNKKRSQHNFHEANLACHQPKRWKRMEKHL